MVCAQRAEVKALWHSCHINRAMCYIKLEEWEKVCLPSFPL